MNTTPAPTLLVETTVTQYSSSTDWIYSSGIDYTVTTNGDLTPTLTPTPESTPTVVIETPVPADIQATQVVTDAPVSSPAPTLVSAASGYNRSVTRSLGFTFSFTVHESGMGLELAPDRTSRFGVISPYSPLGAVWNTLKALGAAIDSFFI